MTPSQKTSGRLTAALGRLRDHVVDGVRVALFLRPSANAFDGGLRMALVLCALHFLASVALPVVAWQGYAVLDAYGLSGDLAGYAVSLVFLAVIPFAASGLSVARVFIGGIATALPCMAAAAALSAAFLYALPSDAMGVPYVAMWLAFLWFQVALFKLVLTLAERWRWPTAIAVVVASVLTAYALPYRSIISGPYAGENPSLLQAALILARGSAPEEAPSQPPRPALDYEAILQRQPALLDAALAGFKASNAEQPSLYFIGMAPYSEQDVFKREVTAVRCCSMHVSEPPAALSCSSIMPTPLKTIPSPACRTWKLCCTAWKH